MAEGSIAQKYPAIAMSGNGISKPRQNSNKKSSGNSGRPSPVSSILSSSFASLGINAKLKEHKVKKIWAECVGESISKRSKPAKLIGATLYCAVSSSPWMNELNYQKNEIMTRLNEKLGEKAVSSIVFKVGPVTSPSPAAAPPKPPRALTNEELDFIDKSAGIIKDGSLKALVKRVMKKAKA